MDSLFLFLAPDRAFLLQKAGRFNLGRPRRFNLLASEPRTIAGRERITDLVRTLGRSHLNAIIDNGDELCHVRPIPAQLKFARKALLASERAHLFGASPYVATSWLGGRLNMASLGRRLRRFKSAGPAAADSVESKPGLRLLGLTEEGDLPLWFSALKHAGCSLCALGCGPLLWERAVARIHPRGPVLLVIAAAAGSVRHLFFIDKFLLFVRSTEATAEALEETLQYVRGRFAADSGFQARLAVFCIASEEALADLSGLAEKAAFPRSKPSASADGEAAKIELHSLSFAELGKASGAPGGGPAVLAALFHYGSSRRTDYCPPFLSTKLVRSRRRRWLLAASGLCLLGASASAVVDGRKILLHSDKGRQIAVVAQSLAASCQRLYEQEDIPLAKLHSLSQLFLQVREKRERSPLPPLSRLEEALACCPQLNIQRLDWSAKKGLVTQGRVEDTDIERGSASFNRLLDRLSREDWRVDVKRRPFSIDGSQALRLTFSDDSSQLDKGRAGFEFRLFLEGS